MYGESRRGLELGEESRCSVVTEREPTEATVVPTARASETETGRGRGIAKKKRKGKGYG